MRAGLSWAAGREAASRRVLSGVQFSPARSGAAAWVTGSKAGGAGRGWGSVSSLCTGVPAAILALEAVVLSPSAGPAIVAGGFRRPSLRLGFGG